MTLVRVSTHCYRHLKQSRASAGCCERSTRARCSPDLDPGTCTALTDEEDVELALLDLLLYNIIYNHISSHLLDPGPAEDLLNLV